MLMVTEMKNRRKLYKEGKKAGRPKKEIDMQLLKDLAEIQCTYEEIAACLYIDRKTLDRNQEYVQAINEARERGKTALRRAQWHKAIVERNTYMLIFLGKNQLQQEDAPSHSKTINQTIFAEYLKKEGLIKK